MPAPEAPQGGEATERSGGAEGVSPLRACLYSNNVPVAALSPLHWWRLLRRLSRMRRRVITRARLHAQEVPGPHHVDLVTFTYRPADEWDPGHLRACLHSYRKQAARDGLPYFRYEWVSELQLLRMRARGESARHCLHYHAILWSPEGYSFPKPDARGWWPWGMTNVEVARNPVGYLAKYASKVGAMDESTGGPRLPRGCRISGGGGLSEVARQELAWWMLPRYVREQFPEVGARVRRARGGGWVDWDTGVWIPAVHLDAIRPGGPDASSPVA